MYPPDTPRAIAFLDGQNLFHAVKECFGYVYPNYDARALALSVCAQRGWKLVQTRFYTGVPDREASPFWNHFWSKKFLEMTRQGVQVYSRPIRYIQRDVCLGDRTHRVSIGDEKGVDVRIAIDVISLAYKNRYDVALLFSQDQDLSEAAEEIRSVAREQRRWIKIASTFPDHSGRKRLNRGVDKTDWIPFDKDFYDACLDLIDYRPPQEPVAFVSERVADTPREAQLPTGDDTAYTYGPDDEDEELAPGNRL